VSILEMARAEARGAKAELGGALCEIERNRVEK
jgi:hypothetical protein